MKRVIKAAKAFSGDTTIKVVYGEGLDSWSPTLMSLTITRPDPKEALAVLLANLDDFIPMLLLMTLTNTLLMKSLIPLLIITAHQMETMITSSCLR